MPPQNSAFPEDQPHGVPAGASGPVAADRFSMRNRLRPFNRILVNMALDGTLAAIAAPLARWLADPRGGLIHPLWFVAGGAITLLVGGVPFRVQQQYWRFSGVADLLAIAGGSVASAILFALLLLATGYSLPTPTFPIIHALVLLILLGGLRIVYRLSQGRPFAGRAGSQRVLLLGADEAADLFIRAVRRERTTPLRVVGLLARGRHQPGRRIHGVPILGTLGDLPLVLERLERKAGRPDGLVIADPELRGEELAAIIRAAEAHAITVGRVPDPTALSPAARVELRPVAIEDLLNRPPVSLDRDGLAALVSGRRVLVTGAGGSIGAELSRQLAALAPDVLILLDHGEFALWQIDLEIAERHPALRRHGVVADIRDAGRLRAVFEAHRPELVFHAAALKHVPIVENNPSEGMLTNIVGTRQVADAASLAGALAMVLISTDKAVNPSSLMGASKRAAEMYCQALDVAARGAGSAGPSHAGPFRGGIPVTTDGAATGGMSRDDTLPGSGSGGRACNDGAVPVGIVLDGSSRGVASREEAGPGDAASGGTPRDGAFGGNIAAIPGGMRCVTVRFGNVLGSTGSVVPLFRRQLERGGPLTVTHPDMQRYFMTVPEAVSLVLQASALGTQGTPAPDCDGGIFVLDMGKPVKIVDLARQMIRLAGLQPGRDVGIRFTGLRPGEKLFEELFHGSEAPMPTGHPGLLIASPRVAVLAQVRRALDNIEAACRAGRAGEAVALLETLVPEFAHNPDGLVPATESTTP